MASSLRELNLDPFGQQPQRIPIYRDEPEFVDRVRNNQNYPVINNPDGSVSTHRMAAESDANGNWYVFPTIQMQDGELVEYYDSRDAMDAAFKTGNILRAPDKQSALNYAEGAYKRDTGLGDRPVSTLRGLQELSPSDPLYIHQDPMPAGADIMTQQEAISELTQRKESARVAGTVSPFQSSFNPFNPNFRATAQNAISNMLGGSNISSNPNYLQGRIANTLSGLVDFAPVVGDAVGVGDTITSYRQGDMLGTGINALATGIGVLPLVGGPASKAVRAGGNRARSALNELEIFQDVFPKSYKESIITPYTDRNIDPRTFSAGSGVGNSDPRVGQVDRNLATQIDIGDQRIPEVPLVSLNDYEGYPFMTTMSDRTAAGDTIRSINGVPVNVSRRGGQNYMLDPVNPEYVWASDESVVLKPKGDGLSDVSMFKFAQDMKARSGGKDTLFMPWTMAPTGGDFSQVGEVMLSYAKNNMGSDAAKALNNDIAKIIPNWKGLNDPMSIADFYAASGNRRKEVIDLMDKKYVHEGSLTSGQARLAMADEGQSMARDGNLRNIGMVDSDRYPYVGNPHPAYSTAMYGEGLGRIDNSLQVYELMPQAAMLGGLADVMRPPRANLRALEMKPYGGIITEDVLRGIEARRQ